MIAGISAIIEPRGPDSDQMRKILTTFLEQNPWSEVAEKDETTRKEVQIVGLHIGRVLNTDPHAVAPSGPNLRILFPAWRSASQRQGLCRAPARPEAIWFRLVHEPRLVERFRRIIDSFRLVPQGSDCTGRASAYRYQRDYR